MKHTLLLIIASILIGGGSASPQTGIPRAQSMFIYNFSRLIEWPSDYKSGNFVIGILGNSTVYNELQSFTAGKKVGAQSIEVQRYKDMSEVGKCHILFVSFSKTDDINPLLIKIGASSTLVISEKNGGINAGSAINFVIEGDKLKFEMKTSNATRQGLKVSTSLQNMAMLID